MGIGKPDESSDTPKTKFTSHQCEYNPKTGTEFVVFHWTSETGAERQVSIWRAPEDGTLWWNVGVAQGNGNNGEERMVRDYLESEQPDDADNIKRILKL